MAAAKICKHGIRGIKNCRECEQARINESKRRAYWADPEKGRERGRLARAADPEKGRAYSRRAYWAEPEKGREYARRAYWAEPDKSREDARLAYWAEPDKSREYSRRSLKKAREAEAHPLGLVPEKAPDPLGLRAVFAAAKKPK